MTKIVVLASIITGILALMIGMVIGIAIGEPAQDIVCHDKATLQKQMDTLRNACMPDQERCRKALSKCELINKALSLTIKDGAVTAVNKVAMKDVGLILMEMDMQRECYPNCPSDQLKECKESLLDCKQGDKLECARRSPEKLEKFDVPEHEEVP